MISHQQKPDYPLSSIPRYSLGSEIRTVIVTFPVFADEVIETTVGAEGLLIAAWAPDENDKPCATVIANKISRNLFTTKACHRAHIHATQIPSGARSAFGFS